MAGPDNQQTKQFIIPFGEATANYTPSELATKIINFETTTEATLATVRGPTLYEPPRGGQPGTAFAEMHGIFHANLMGGTSDTLLVRAGRICIGTRAGSVAGSRSTAASRPTRGPRTPTSSSS
jgi:hypothetical protein